MVAHHPGLAVGLADLAATLAGREVSAADLEPWAALTGIPVDGEMMCGCSVNHAPTAPHVDRWATDPEHVTVLTVYRDGFYGGGELCWAGGRVDLQHGDVAVVPAGLEHWNLPRSGGDYRRIVVAYRGRLKIRT